MNVHQDWNESVIFLKVIIGGIVLLVLSGIVAGIIAITNKPDETILGIMGMSVLFIICYMLGDLFTRRFIK